MVGNDDVLNLQRLRHEFIESKYNEYAGYMHGEYQIIDSCFRVMSGKGEFSLPYLIGRVFMDIQGVKLGEDCQACQINLKRIIKKIENVRDFHMTERGLLD